MFGYNKVAKHFPGNESRETPMECGHLETSEPCPRAADQRTDPSLLLCTGNQLLEVWF